MNSSVWRKRASDLQTSKFRFVVLLVPSSSFLQNGPVKTKRKGWCCQSLYYSLSGYEKITMLSGGFPSVMYPKGFVRLLLGRSYSNSSFLLGIFPREPRSRKKANKGSSAPTSFYYAKDIAYLAHEPVLRKLREHKAFAKKLSRALGRGEWSSAKSLEEQKPVYTLDHIIKERCALRF